MIAGPPNKFPAPYLSIIALLQRHNTHTHTHTHIKGQRESARARGQKRHTRTHTHTHRERERERERERDLFLQIGDFGIEALDSCRALVQLL